MTKKRKILFLCTGNSCRSQMAEAILKHLGSDRFEAYSAGSNPAGFVHPLAVEALAQLGIPPGASRSKSWDEFADVPMDVVITVCDAAAGQPCPNWSGAPLKSHWSLPDPAYHPGTMEDRVEFAVRVAVRLQTKIQGLLDLDWSQSSDVLRRELGFLGEI